MKKTASPLARLIVLCEQRNKVRKDLFFYVKTRNDAKTRELQAALKSIEEKIRALETGR